MRKLALVLAMASLPCWAADWQNASDWQSLGGNSSNVMYSPSTISDVTLPKASDNKNFQQYKKVWLRVSHNPTLTNDLWVFNCRGKTLNLKYAIVDDKNNIIAEDTLELSIIKDGMDRYMVDISSPGFIQDLEKIVCDIHSS